MASRYRSISTPTLAFLRSSTRPTLPKTNTLHPHSSPSSSPFSRQGPPLPQTFLQSPFRSFELDFVVEDWIDFMVFGIFFYFLFVSGCNRECGVCARCCRSIAPCRRRGWRRAWVRIRGCRGRCLRVCFTARSLESDLLLCFSVRVPICS